MQSKLLDRHEKVFEGGMALPLLLRKLPLESLALIMLKETINW